MAALPEAAVLPAAAQLLLAAAAQLALLASWLSRSVLLLLLAGGGCRWGRLQALGRKIQGLNKQQAGLNNEIKELKAVRGGGRESAVASSARLAAMRCPGSFVRVAGRSSSSSCCCGASIVSAPVLWVLRGTRVYGIVA